MTCPSTFGNGTHQCQIPDPKHQIHHQDGAIRWCDKDADETQGKAV